MSISPTYDRESLECRAAAFFDRPGFSLPVFVGTNELAMIDDRSGVTQVSRLALDSHDVTAMTSFSDRVLSLVGSSNGTVVFGMDHGGDEFQQVWVRDPSSKADRRVTDAADSIHEPGCISPDGRFAMIRSNARNEAEFDIVSIETSSGAQSVWWENAGQSIPVALSRSGQQCLVVRSNGNLDSDVILLTRSGTQNVVTSQDQEAWILDADFHPVDGSIWWLSNADGEFVRLERFYPDEGITEGVFATDWDVHAFAIAPDGSRVILAVNDNGWSNVGIFSLAAPQDINWLDLPRGTIDRFAWSPDSSQVAFGLSTATSPSAIMIAGLDGSVMSVGGEPDPETNPPAVEPELIHFTTFDDLDIPAFLFKPAGEGPHPVLVEIHGGPEGQRHLQYSSAVPTNQLIQSVGIAVLSLNVRGSTGYGRTYTHLDDKAHRMDAVRDVAAAVDWLRKRDDVIHDRIGVMGQSYGGFMTLASIVEYPDLWAAAVDVVGIANFVTFMERTGPWRRAHRAAEYGSLEDDRDLLERISPIHGVDRIVAPLHMIHGRNDPRVPLHEAEQMKAALDARNHPVSLRVFDDEGHGLYRRENRISGYAEATAFLIEHLLG